MISETISAKEYEEFCKFLEAACGIVLGDKKHYLITSRLNHISAESGLGSLAAVVAHLKENPNSPLRGRIVDAMTTNETLWFRDNYPYEILKEKILLELAKKNRPIRIWSAACSSGQEPYSISMVVQDLLQSRPGCLPHGVQIIATDISPTILEEARNAAYDGLSLTRGLTIERRNRYFDDLGNQRWQVKPEVRRRVTFQEFNLQKSYMPLGRFDIIFCRNVLIYFSVKFKTDIITRMAQILDPDGYFFLGASESMAGYSNCFETVKIGHGLVYRVKR